MPVGRVKIAKLLILWWAKNPQDVQRKKGMINAQKIVNLFIPEDTESFY